MSFKLIPIGYIRKGADTFIEILPEFLDAIEGLQDGDWIKLILWFHKSDKPELRKILKVHPYGNPKNPLRGVFATRSPYRPNPLALYTVKIREISDNRIYIDWIDADDGTPVVDIKIFVERYDCPNESIEEREVNIPKGRIIGELNIIPRKSDHLDELEEVSPDEFDAVIIELGNKTTVLSARELTELIEVLKEIYDELPVEIKDKLRVNRPQD
ncbi:tRNA (N6-threonylcarbamoyladenosine(37)-N6)-methyltransferase TrmO [Pyrococcus abyssi]|nr:tRNA (N6-threonylcarbamoyladenosine(37)-N6)-methyltransferase TrmO [Pyrococcus abyssi]CCE70340.1 TPA: virr related protein [Pyrococcus abyssi GE5]